MLYNAMALGFNLELLVTCRTPDTFYMPPFFCPNATQEDGPDILVSSVVSPVTSAASQFPECLRPTLAQILVPQHTSLDLIPFPRFRGKVIIFSAALPHIFNMGELKIDIYCSNALSVSAPEPSQPWDWKSRKAAPWFVSKWRLAVDEDGELDKIISG